MKEFFNWLGVNEKIAKLIFWLFVIMGFLIMFNTLLDSLGLPYYKVTVENLSKIKLNNFLNKLCALIVSLMNFYSIIFLVIRIKEIKKVFPYSMVYIVIIVLIGKIFPYAINQIIITGMVCLFLFLISNKNKRYILYGLLALFISSLVQYICLYLFKVKYIADITIEGLNYLFTSLDYFIFIFFIILVKEVYLKYKKEA